MNEWITLPKGNESFCTHREHIAAYMKGDVVACPVPADIPRIDFRLRDGTLRLNQNPRRVFWVELNDSTIVAWRPAK